MERFRTLGLFAFILSVMFAACRKEKVREERDDTDKLYENLSTLIQESLLQIDKCADSTEVEEKFRIFNERLDSINFAVEINTDLLLNEAENDSLTRGIEKVVEVYHARLKFLENPGSSSEEKKDSVLTGEIS